MADNSTADDLYRIYLENRAVGHNDNPKGEKKSRRRLALIPTLVQRRRFDSLNPSLAQRLATSQAGLRLLAAFLIVPNIAGNLLTNANSWFAPLGKDVADRAKVLGDQIGDLVDGGTDTIEVPGQEARQIQLPPELVEGENFDEGQLVSVEQGEIQFNQDEVDKVASEIVSLQSAGVKDFQILVTGFASDEWYSSEGNGINGPDEENLTLAQRRSDAFKAQLEPALADLDVSVEELSIGYSFREVSLSLEDTRRLESLYTGQGYESLDQVIALHADPAQREQLPVDLRNAMDELFARGAFIGFKGEIPDRWESQTKLEPAKPPTTKEVDDGDPFNPKRDYDWNWFFTPLPLLGLIGLAVPPGFSTRPTYAIKRRPAVVKESGVVDETFVQLDSDAFEPDGGFLIPGAGRRTRKHLYLYQNGRIKGSIANRSDENSVRIEFVDHEPSPEAIAALSKMVDLLEIAKAAGAAGSLHTIFVYPSENCGVQDDPTTIGLGLDEQTLQKETVGFAYPALGIAELQMPTTPAVEQLYTFLMSLRTFAHENHGHFTDAKAETRGVVYDSRKDVYTTANPWLKKGASAASDARKNRNYWQVENPDGSTATITTQELVEKFLSDKDAVIRRIGAPTPYAEKNENEFYAETVAAYITGDLLPFQAWGIETDHPGYEISKQAEELSEAGTSISKDDITNKNISKEISYLPANEDPLIIAAAAEASEKGYPTELRTVSAHVRPAGTQTATGTTSVAMHGAPRVGRAARKNQSVTNSKL